MLELQTTLEINLRINVVGETGREVTCDSDKKEIQPAERLRKDSCVVLYPRNVLPVTHVNQDPVGVATKSA